MTKQQQSKPYQLLGSSVERIKKRPNVSSKLTASATVGGAGGSSGEKKKRVRLSREERERLIISNAIDLFAEEGFGGQTRALAGRMNVTHSVLYQHFPSKDALIDRVYREVFLRRWNPQWSALLRDRSIPFEKRVEDFYMSYAEAIFDPSWVRIFLYAGLKQIGIPNRYYARVRRNVILPLCEEFMAARGENDEPEQDAFVEEQFWALHGAVFFLGIRKFVYNVKVPTDLAQTVSGTVRAFLGGIAADGHTR